MVYPLILQVHCVITDLCVDCWVKLIFTFRMPRLIIKHWLRHAIYGKDEAPSARGDSKPDADTPVTFKSEHSIGDDDDDDVVRGDDDDDDDDAGQDVEPRKEKPVSEMTEEERIAELGKPRLGEITRVQCHIRESMEFKVR